MTESTIRTAARTVVAAQQARLLERLPGTREGKDPEELHAMRVASRRLRAALRAFEDAFPRRLHARLTRDLCWLGRNLGAVRDLDVQIERLAQERSSLPRRARAGLAVLAAHHAAERRRLRARLVAALASPRFRSLLAALDRFARGEPSREPAPLAASAPVGLFGALAVEKAARRLAKAGGRALQEPTEGAIHETRIRAKRVRYLIEFLDEASAGAGRGLIARLTALQDLLGAHQDAVVARDLTRAFLARRAHRLTASQRAALSARAAREEALAASFRAEFAGAWRRFSAQALDRAAGRVVAALRGPKKKNGDAATGVP